MDPQTLNSYLSIINIGINMSFYLWYVVRVLYKNCHKNIPTNLNINDLSNMQNEQYKKIGNQINIKNLDEIVSQSNVNDIENQIKIKINNIEVDKNTINKID